MGQAGCGHHMGSARGVDASPGWRGGEVRVRASRCARPSGRLGTSTTVNSTVVFKTLCSTTKPKWYSQYYGIFL
jgi:hypothetical protein